MHQNIIDKYKEMVKLLASFSKNKRLKVGCLILKNGRIVSTGYNGTLPNSKEEVIMIDGHDQSTLHSEQNALMHCCNVGIATNDCIMLVSHFPCQICTKLAIMAGIKKIYYVEDYRNEDNPFANQIECIKVD